RRRKSVLYVRLGSWRSLTVSSAAWFHRRSASCQSLLQRLSGGWFDEMSIEARSLNAPTVGFLTVSRQGDQANAVSGMDIPNQPGDVTPVDPWQTNVDQRDMRLG